MRNIVLSPSRQDKIQACPRKFYFNHVLNKTMVDKPSYFVEGEFVHYILENHYKAKKNGSFSIDEIIEKARNFALGLSLTLEVTEFLIKIYKDYCLYYQNETYEVLGVEDPFAKVLWEDEKANLRVIVQGKIDLRVRNHQGIEIVVDHKKIARERTVTSRNNQVLTYCWATGCRDFLYNQFGIQKSYTSEKRFKRHHFNIVQHQIDEWIENTIYSALEITRYYEVGHFPHRYTACQYENHLCEFIEVCQSPVENWEYKLEGAFMNHEDHDLMASISEE